MRSEREPGNRLVMVPLQLSQKGILMAWISNGEKKVISVWPCS